MRGRPRSRPTDPRVWQRGVRNRLRQKARAGDRRAFPWNPNYRVPPGETLLETLETNGMTAYDLSRRTMIPYQTIKLILAGKAEITAEIAAKLELETGVSADFWLQLEADYRGVKPPREGKFPTREHSLESPYQNRPKLTREERRARREAKRASGECLTLEERRQCRLLKTDTPAPQTERN